MHNAFPINVNSAKIELNPNDKIIKNKWYSIDTAERHNIEVSPILDANSVEGLTINRYRSMNKGLLSLNNEEGHLFSLIKGDATLNVNNEPKPLYITSGNHLYVPPGASAVLHLSANALVIQVSGPQRQAVGTTLIVRNERFARAARDVLTPQYLSRRIFTNRDKTLCSKYGTQVAWFHTTS